jgi:hypothetical protein
MDTFIEYFFLYAPWVILAPISLSLVFYRKLSPELRVIFYYLVISLIVNIASFILWRRSTNNLFLLHIFTVVEFLLLLWFFYFLLRAFLPASLFIVLAVTFTLFAAYDSFYLEDVKQFNIYGLSVQALLLIFLCVSWFVKTISEPDPLQATKIPYLLVVGGLLICYSGSLILFAFQEQIDRYIKLTSQRLNIWSLRTLLVVMVYLLTTAALWKQRKT